MRPNNVSKGLRLNNSELKSIFNSESDIIQAVIHYKLKEDIGSNAGLSDFEISIGEIEIKKINNLIVEVLFDERTVHEYSEINYSGLKERRKINPAEIDLWQYIRKDYEFRNLTKVTDFRVEGTNETFTCRRCNGSTTNTCGHCSGSGKNRCSSCSGRGQKRCSSCYGKGQRNCWSCNGSGQKTERGANNEQIRVNCSNCGGRGSNPCNSCTNGYVNCDTCSGQGQVTCFNCSGRGAVPCSTCDAQGYFTRFLNVKSEIKSKSRNEYLNGSPDRWNCSRTITEEIFSFDKSWGKYPITDLKNHSSDLKILFEKQLFTNSQSPKKIKFQLDEVVSMSFKIRMGSSTYLGGLKNGGELFYDKSIVSQLFFTLLDKFEVTENFKSLDRIEKTIVGQIEGFKSVYENINEFRKFDAIIKSSDPIEKKLNKTRGLKNINVKNYLEHLSAILKSKVQRALILTVLLSHVVLLILAFNISSSPIIWTLTSAVTAYFFTKFTAYSSIDNHKPENDASNTTGGVILMSIIITAVFALIMFLANQ